MKLYATTTSERASKGQGGNKFLEINILDEHKNEILFIRCIPDGTNIRTFIKPTERATRLQATTLYIPKGREQGADNCPKCNEIHDVEKAGGHDLLQAERIAICECEDHPEDEFCKQILKGNKQKSEECINKHCTNKAVTEGSLCAECIPF